MLLQVALDALKNVDREEQTAAQSLSDVLDRAGAAIRDAHDFVKYTLVKDPASFDSGTEKIEVRWHVWARKEGKLRERIKGISEARKSISATMMALNSLSL